MDYEEMMLQVTDVLKAHNRYHMNAPDHEQAVKAIREIVTPKGKWITWADAGNPVPSHNRYECSICHDTAPALVNGFDLLSDFCPNCGADMRGDV